MSMWHFCNLWPPYLSRRFFPCVRLVLRDLLYIVLCILVYTINTQRYYIYPLENLYIVPEVELYRGENVPEIRRKTCLLEKLNA